MWYIAAVAHSILPVSLSMKAVDWNAVIGSALLDCTDFLTQSIGVYLTCILFVASAVFAYTAFIAWGIVVRTPWL